MFCVNLNKKSYSLTFRYWEISGKVGRYLHFGCEKCILEKKVNLQSATKNRNLDEFYQQSYNLLISTQRA